MQMETRVVKDLMETRGTRRLTCHPGVWWSYKQGVARTSLPSHAAVSVAAAFHPPGLSLLPKVSWEVRGGRRAVPRGSGWGGSDGRPTWPRRAPPRAQPRPAPRSAPAAADFSRPAGPQHFRPRPAELQIPAALAQGPLPRPHPRPSPRTLRETLGLEIEQNRLVGEGRGRGRRGHGEGAPAACAAPHTASGPPRAPQLPGAETAACAPRTRGRSRRGSPLAPTAARGPSPGAPQALPHSGANLGLGSRSSCAVRGRRRDAAHSRFPEAPGADGFLSAAREAGARSPALPWGRAPGGGGAPRDNDRFEAGLGAAPLSPRAAPACVPPARRVQESGSGCRRVQERGSGCRRVQERGAPPPALRNLQGSQLASGWRRSVSRPCTVTSRNQ